MVSVGMDISTIYPYNSRLIFGRIYQYISRFLQKVQAFRRLLRCSQQTNLHETWYALLIWCNLHFI
eukprot:SAG31_NODE_13814_length_844_cov_7.649664_2_plen_65_part_01